MQTKFTWEFRSSEAAANSRLLARTLYGNAGFYYGLLTVLAPVLVMGVALVGVYHDWWGDYYPAAVIVAAMLVILILRLGRPWLRRVLFKPPHGGGEIEGRRVDYMFGEDGYRIETETFEGFQKWAGVDRIIDAKGSVMFVLGLNAHFIPDRLFASPEARREFLAWAAGKLMPEARARSRIGEISRTG